MNETLKQIAIEAQVEHCVSHVRLQEFADLIVQECVAQCLKAKQTKYITHPPIFMISQDEVVDDCVMKMKEHFGVTE